MGARIRWISLAGVVFGATCALASAAHTQAPGPATPSPSERPAPIAPVAGEAAASTPAPIAPVAGEAAARKQVSIGVLAFRGAETTGQNYGPTAEYLTAQVPGYVFRVVPMLSLEEAEELVRDRKVDFVATQPAQYALLEHRYGLTRMLTMRNQTPVGPISQFGAVIIVRKDSSIRTLQDLRKRSFMGVNPNGFGGFLMTKKVLLDHGINPERDLTLSFCGFPQDQVPKAVLAGKVDAGTIRTDVLERMAANNRIRMDDFRVLHQQKSMFPYAHSTPLYPEWAFAVNRGVDEDLAQRVAIALLGMPKDHPAARAAKNAGWTVPLDYAPVHQLLRDLREPPYENMGKVSLAQIVRQYWHVIALTLLGIAVLIATTVYVIRLNRQIRRTNARLAAEMEERRIMHHQLLASEKMASLGQLAAGVAHEINSPLAFVYSNVGTLGRSLPKLIELVQAYEQRVEADSAAIRSEIARLREESGIEFLLEDAEDLIDESLDGLRRMRDIVSDMKSFSHVGDNDWQVVDLREGLQSTINIVKRTKKAHGELRLDFQPIPVIECLASQLNQVFMNLLLNAYDAIDDRGVITVRTRPYDADHVCVEVSDNGPGISEETLKRIFDPFYTTKGAGRGSGLGLAISLKIVTTHTGRIEVDSEIGLGTTFRIILPHQPDRAKWSDLPAPLHSELPPPPAVARSS